MKKIILLILVSLFTLTFLAAQGWEKDFEDNIQVSGLSNDGGIILATTTIANDSLVSRMTKVDSLGNIVWQKDEVYQTTQQGGWQQQLLQIEFDTSFLLVTTFDSDLPFLQSFKKYTQDGDLVWEYYYQDQRIRNISDAGNGDCFVLANTGNGNYLQKIDADANPIWQQNYPSNELVLISKVCLAANNEIIVLGTKQIGRLDALGNLLWIDDTITGANLYFNNLVESTSGDFIVTAQRWDPAVSEYSAELLRISGNGTLISSVPNSRFDWPNSFTGSYPTINELPDGSILIAGAIKRAVGLGRDLSLLKLDASGNEVWYRKYGQGRPESFQNFLVANPDRYYFAGTFVSASDFADGYLVSIDSEGFSYRSQIKGAVVLDENENCMLDNGEQQLKNWLITATKGTQQYVRVTNANGEFEFLVDTGEYELTTMPYSVYWGLCDSSLTVNLENITDTICQNIFAIPLVECPILDVSIGTNVLRRCFENTYQVRYCNIGTQLAEDVSIDLVIDSYLTYTGSSLPGTPTQSGDTLTFLLNDMEMGDCNNFEIYFNLGDATNCDSIPLGMTHCIEAHIYPDSICIPTPMWSGASVEVDAQCAGDTIQFTLTNVGSAATQSDLGYIIVEDDVVLFQGGFQLDVNETEVISVPTNGSTFRLEAEQEPNHPGVSMPSVSVENCGAANSIFTFGFVNVFDQNDGNPSVDIDCRENTGSYDPNDKTGFPLGRGAENIIGENQEIEYLIRFQNTGTDTAFTVVIRDVLSELLDISTLRTGASSHDYQYTVKKNYNTETYTLDFNFENIMLPDSNVNLAASNGFVKFKISPKSNIPLGTQINNQAKIYFDFNVPITTNETLHTIGEELLMVSIDEPSEFNRKNGITCEVFPNPFMENATITVEGRILNNAHLKLYNLSGQLIKELQPQNNSFVVTKSGLESSVYFFAIEDEGEIVATGKIMKQ